MMMGRTLDASKEGGERLLSKGNRKGATPVENAELKSPPSYRPQDLELCDNVDKELGHAKQHAWFSPPSVQSKVSINAAQAAYEYQQQQAYYAQQFYLQRQQQRYPGYVPWPAPSSLHPFFVAGAGYPMNHPQLPTSQRRSSPSSPTTNTRKVAPSQASNQDDEYVALLQTRLAQVGGYGSLSSDSTSNLQSLSVGTNQGRTSPTGNISIGKQTNTEDEVCRPHRRAQSDIFIKSQQQQPQPHPLKSTAAKEKPPMGKSPRVPVANLSSPKGRGVNRSLSASSNSGILQGGLPSNLQQRHTHRRSASSASSVGAASVASEASFLSVTSDIRKSAFFGGVDKETGRTQLHYPNERIFVCTDDPSLTVGKVYKVAVDEEIFEEYHRQAEDAMWEDDLEFSGNNVLGNSSSRRHNRVPFGALPPNQFALAVDPSVYKRVLDEIRQAQFMPCGLFFCGHHEDVAHPSIKIAVLLLIAMFLTMGTVAFLAQD